MNNKPVAPSNEALIKSGNKSSFVVSFRNTIHLFGTFFPKENSLAVILNVITTSVVRLLENRFDSLDFKYMQLYLIAVSLFQSICKVSGDGLEKFSYYKCLPGFRFRGMSLSYNLLKVKQH